MNADQPGNNSLSQEPLNIPPGGEDTWAVPVAVPLEGNADDLKRWGFVQTIRHRYDAECDPDALLKVYREKVLEEMNRVEGIYKMIRDRLEEKIRSLRARVQELKERKELEDPLVAELKRRKGEVELQMAELRKRILDVRRRMATAKEDMLDKWLDKAGAQMKKALALQKEVYEQTMLINGQRFKDGGATFAHYKTQFQLRRQQFQDRYDLVQEQMKVLGMEGVNPLVAKWVLGIGTSVAAAAGYFFSVFTATGKFGNNDTLFYILTGLMHSAGQPSPAFIFKLLFILGLVLLLAAVSVGCYFLINFLFPPGEGDSENEFSFRAAGMLVRDHTRASVRLKAGSWLAFWLQVTPLVIIFGVLLVLLGTYDPQGLKIGGLNTSIEGVLAGTALAMGMGALVYLYIIKIMEPRMQRARAGGEPAKLSRQFELVLLVVLFVLCTAAMTLIRPGTGGLPAWFTSVIAITEFIAVALLAGIAIGYGLRFRGLFGMSQYLQSQLTRYDNIVAELCGPELPAGGADISGEMKKMLEQVLAASSDKALLLRGITPTRTTAPLPKIRQAEKKQGTGMLDWLSRLFKWRKPEPPSGVENLVQLSEWERRYFPDLDEEIRVLGFEYGEFEKEMHAIESRLDNLQAEQAGGQSEKQQEIRNQEIQVEASLTKLEHAATDHLRQRSSVEDNIFRSETAILEGYHLGIWYREAQMGPGDDYYRRGRDPLYFLKIYHQPKLLTYGTQ